MAKHGNNRNGVKVRHVPSQMSLRKHRRSGHSGGANRRQRLLDECAAKRTAKEREPPPMFDTVEELMRATKEKP
jgi:hypothetical protein